MKIVIVGKICLLKQAWQAALTPSCLYVPLTARRTPINFQLGGYSAISQRSMNEGGNRRKKRIDIQIEGNNRDENLQRKGVDK